MSYEPRSGEWVGGCFTAVGMASYHEMLCWHHIMNRQCYNTLYCCYKGIYFKIKWKITTQPTASSDSPYKLWLRFEKRVTKSRQANEQRQFPLSSAVLYWRDWPNERVLPDEVSLRTIFARYGRVRSVVMTSENSAVVVFEDLRDCCDLIQASDIQVLLDKTVLLVKATWYHRPLQNRDFYRAGGALATVMKRPITYWRRQKCN